MIKKKIPVSTSFMSRQTLGAYSGLYLIPKSTENSTQDSKGYYTVALTLSVTVVIVLDSHPKFQF